MLQPGTQIGRYEIQRRLGRGGMGTVYVAHDPVLGRMVAVKVFLSDLEMADAAERFAREARAAAALNHPNIVTIHDFGDMSSQPYIVMEYVQGETVAEIIRRKAPVTIAEKLRWIEELCAGAVSAHKREVIHRDIKPTNLMIDRSGRLKILDFGIAKVLGTLGSNATALIGTPGYMAPEQILGHPLDHRSDLFSIAVVLYELLSYKEAFTNPGETMPTITHRIVSGEPTPISHLVPDIHPELVSVVETGLKKKPSERFPDAEALRLALNRVRRQLESDPQHDKTIISPPLGATVPMPPAHRPGTGSARKHSHDAVSVAELTPPPDPRRTDREARRAAQIEASIQSARAHRANGDLEAALDACQQVLLLDPAHVIALDLEDEIETALARVKAGVLITDARAELERGQLTAAQNFLEQARALGPDTPEAKRLERDLRLARVEQERQRQRAEAVQRAVASARSSLAKDEIEAALTFAREALDLDSTSSEARAVEADALRRLDGDLAVVAPAPVAPLEERTVLRRAPAPAAPSVAAKPSPAKEPSTQKRKAIKAPPGPPKPRPDYLAPVRTAFVTGIASAKAATQGAVQALVKTTNAIPKKQRLIIASSVAAILVVAAVGIAMMMRPAAVVPTGTLVIDAVPWAMISSIQDVNRTEHPVPAPGSTPLSLGLPVGTYQIRLVGPPPDSTARTITVQIQAGALTTAPNEIFQTVTPEQYFEPYLNTLAPAAPDAAAPADGAVPGATGDTAAVPGAAAAAPVNPPPAAVKPPGVNQ
jgi:serine/threonine protein kinase